MHRALPGSVLLTFAATATAAPVELTGAALKEMVAGSVIALDAPLGNKVPMSFGADGIVSGQAPGMIGTFLGAAKDRGRWWIERDRLCIKWFRWFSGESRCMTISADGNRIAWRRDDGDSGTATLVERAGPASKPATRVATVETQAKAVTAAPPATGTVAPAVKSAESKPKAVAPKPAPSKTVQVRKPDETEAAARYRAPIALSDMVRPSHPAPALKATSQTSADSAPAQAPAAEAALAPAGAPAPLDPAALPPASNGEAMATAAAPRQAQQAPVRVAAVEPPQPRNPYAPPSRLSAAGDERAILTFRVAGVHPRDVLNVRAGPSEYHEPVGVIPPFGRGVVMIGACQGLWCPVRHGRTTGWVNRYYLMAE